MNFLTEKQVSEQLKVSVSWLRKCRLTGIGGPPFRKFGTLVRYEEKDLMEWAEGQKRESTLTVNQ